MSLLSKEVLKVPELPFQDLVFGTERSVVQLQSRALLDCLVELELKLVCIGLLLLPTAYGRIPIFLTSYRCSVLKVVKDKIFNIVALLNCLFLVFSFAWLREIIRGVQADPTVGHSLSLHEH